MREMKLKGNQRLDPTIKDNWLGGPERVEVISLSAGLSVSFKVYANSPERHSAVEMLFACIQGKNDTVIEFSFLEDDYGVMLLFRVMGVDFDIGYVPDVLAEKMLIPYWDNIEKNVVFDRYSIELSMAGEEIDRDQLMRVADDEEVLDDMSEAEFVGFIDSVKDAAMAEVYVIRACLIVSRTPNDFLTGKGFDNG